MCIEETSTVYNGRLDKEETQWMSLRFLFFQLEEGVQFTHIYM